MTAALLIALTLGCQPKPAECTLGSIYGDAPTIDPDAPVYSDTEWTQTQVEEAFAQARAADDSAYRAYAFAHGPDGTLLECPFCACGCKALYEHASAIDCFKDMHGFT